MSASGLQNTTACNPGGCHSANRPPSPPPSPAHTHPKPIPYPTVVTLILDFSAQILLFLLPAAPRKQVPLCPLFSPRLTHPMRLPPNPYSIPGPSLTQRSGTEWEQREGADRTTAARSCAQPANGPPTRSPSIPPSQPYPIGTGAGGGRCRERGTAQRGELHKGARRLSALSTDRAVGKASRKSAFKENK